MLDVRLLRTLLVVALSLPVLTLLATWGESAERLAQVHPAILAATQLLASLTAMLAEAAERDEPPPQPRAVRSSASFTVRI